MDTLFVIFLILYCVCFGAILLFAVLTMKDIERQHRVRREWREGFKNAVRN